MNKFMIGLSALFFILCSVVSCEREQVVKESKVTIHATIIEDSPSTKTSIDEAGKVYWIPGDDFYVYSASAILGADAPSNFVSDLDQSSTSADFTGELDVDEYETYFAFYPGSSSFYSYWGEESSGTMDSQISGYLTPDQYESYDPYNDSFDFDGNMLLVAMSEGSVDQLSFMNVCSGLKFSLSEAGYTEVSIRGNDGEPIAGEFSLDFEPSKEPVITSIEGTETVVKITSSSGLIDGEWLYLLILPQTFENGITISFKKNGIAAGSVIIESPVEFKRGIWKRAANIDKRAEFDENQNITFADPEVKRICVKNWDTSGDGELSFAEAAEVTDLMSVFYQTKIKYFDEFKYFTGVTDLHDAYAASCFGGCSSLETITLPSSLTSLGRSAFYNCTALQSLIIPEGVTEVGNGCFSKCSSMEYLDFPSTITSIGNSSVDNCDNLKVVVFRCPKPTAAGSWKGSFYGLIDKSLSTIYVVSDYVSYYDGTIEHFYSTHPEMDELVKPLEE